MRLLVLSSCLVACSHAHGLPDASPDGHSPPTDPDAFVMPDAIVLPDAGPPRAPGCNLSAPAFCETFEDGPHAPDSRTGELDPERWSVWRFDWDDQPVPPTVMPRCRDGVSGRSIGIADGTVVCEPIERLASRHYLAAMQLGWRSTVSARVRQPFDFRDRVGTVTFEIARECSAGAYEWVGLVIAPSTASIPASEWRVPRDALVIELNKYFSEITLWRDFVRVAHVGGQSPWVEADDSSAGPSRFELRVSRSHLELAATAPSTDGGRTFGELEPMASLDVDGLFERAYVQLGAVSLAANVDDSSRCFGRWDNVGFDGPIVREPSDRSAPSPPAAYTWALPVALGLERVELRGASAAELRILVTGAESLGSFDYRVNGGVWRRREMDAAERSWLDEDHFSDGVVDLGLDLPVDELRDGTNTIELASENLYSRAGSADLIVH
jgi:hypothetical protein